MNDETDTSTEAQESRQAEDPVFLYKDSGIREKHGHVPLWLWGVVVALLIWGVYYTIAYWSPR
ncbi:MAG TPA: hypothetical protein VKC56_08400 [Gallionellaceae bacterium]|nr:hypothetical protein [Gallionellaceae bacterium]